MAAATLGGVLRGLWGFAAFCFLAAVLVKPLGTGPAFAVALAGTLTLQLCIGRLRNARATRRTALTTAHTG
ncbi:hypothetical protein [Kitasatospora camelliae]|uniref:Uncharacterized protein n=1 Tax=Kitasatospora camelliae TaxID=3156397 RepID=A0AAU8JQL4_9ACTN